MNLNVAHIMQYKMLFIAVLIFFLGMLFSYLWFLGKQRKDDLDKKKIESYVKGLNYIIEDDTDKAIEEFTKTAKIDPDLIDIYISIGNLFRKKGEINRALIIHKSLLVRPHLDKKKKLEIYINIGIDYRKAGLYDRAKEYFKNALSIESKNILAKKLLYEVYEDSKDWENALIWHKKFGGDDDHILSHIHTEIGKEKLAEKDYNSAKKHFEKALKIDRGCIDAQIHLGDVFYQYGDLDKAYNQWENAAKKKPELANIALKRISDIERLKKTVITLLTNARDDKYTLYFCANQLYDIGEQAKAIAIYKKLIKMGIKSTSMFQKFVDAKKDSLPDFIINYTLNEKLEDVRYTCTNCGYTSHTLFFRCPKCRQWDKLKVKIV